MHLMGEEPRPVPVVLKELRSAGYTASADKVQRLRSFGIRSTRIGRDYYYEPATIGDLRYVLDVESAYGLARDHDGLALELAYRGFPHIPWKRVHRAARKRPGRIMKRIDRELHRVAKVRGKGFSEDAIAKLAIRMARHWIPDRKLDEDLSSGLARELLEATAKMLLRGAYHGRPFQEIEIRKIVMSLGVPETMARPWAAEVAGLLNQRVLPMIRVNNTNSFHKMANRNASVLEVKAAIEMMRSLQFMIKRLQAEMHLRPNFDIEEYPHIHRRKDPLAFIDFAIHCVYYTVALDFIRDKQVRENLARYRAGEAPEIEQTLTNMRTTIELIPKAIKKQYEK
jgi:hypothetical protein